MFQRSSCLLSFTAQQQDWSAFFLNLSEKKIFCKRSNEVSETGRKKSLSRSTSCLTFCALMLIFTIGCFFGKSSLIQMQGPEERCGTFISFELRQIALLQDLLDKTATGCLNWLWLPQRWLISWKVFFYPEAHFWQLVLIIMGKGHKFHLTCITEVVENEKNHLLRHAWKVLVTKHNGGGF